MLMRMIFFFIIAEEIEIHSENMMFPRALQCVSCRAANIAHSLMAGATGLSHPIPHRDCPETAR